MKDIFQMIKNMVKENMYLMMVKNMLEKLITIKFKDMGK